MLAGRTGDWVCMGPRWEDRGRGPRCSRFQRQDTMHAVPRTACAATALPPPKHTTHNTRPGQLLVSVLHAADVRASDLNGLSDPYVKLRLENKSTKAKTQKTKVT